MTNWLKVTTSPDGERLVAVAYPSSVFMSTNGGQIWTFVRNFYYIRATDLASSADVSTLAVSIYEAGFGG